MVNIAQGVASFLWHSSIAPDENPRQLRRETMNGGVTVYLRLLAATLACSRVVVPLLSWFAALFATGG